MTCDGAWGDGGGLTTKPVVEPVKLEVLTFSIPSYDFPIVARTHDLDHPRFRRDLGVRDL